MHQFDLNTIIDKHDIDTTELSSLLFPNAKYPKKALSRIIEHKSNLDSVQLEKLAAFIGVPIQDLFCADMWNDSYDNGVLTFTKKDYSAKINYNGAFITMYYKGRQIDRIVASKPYMSIKELTNLLDTIINSFCG